MKAWEKRDGGERLSIPVDFSTFQPKKIWKVSVAHRYAGERGGWYHWRVAQNGTECVGATGEGARSEQNPLLGKSRSVAAGKRIEGVRTE